MTKNLGNTQGDDHMMNCLSQSTNLVPFAALFADFYTNPVSVKEGHYDEVVQAFVGQPARPMGATKSATRCGTKEFNIIDDQRSSD